MLKNKKKFSTFDTLKWVGWKFLPQLDERENVYQGPNKISSAQRVELTDLENAEK